MRRIAISGHRSLPTETEKIVNQAIRRLLESASGGITGLSCLADGADQLFASAVLEHGGGLEVIVPAQQYREGLPEAAHAEYDRLMSAATDVYRLHFTESDSEAHMAASAYMINQADELWAVWDGRPARGYGGTADVVTYARDHKVPVRVIWPEGARRD